MTETSSEEFLVRILILTGSQYLELFQGQLWEDYGALYTMTHLISRHKCDLCSPRPGQGFAKGETLKAAEGGGKEVLSSLSSSSFSLYSLSLSWSMSRRRFYHLYPFHCIRYPCHCQCQEEGFIRFSFLCICQCNFNCNFLISNDSVKIMISKYFWGIVKRFARLRSRFEKVRASEPKTVSYLVCII